MLLGNLLDIWSLIDPQRIFVKLKLHILLHILQDVINHGTPLLNSTEIFESHNAVFRNSSVLSNHQAPSCDIARTSAVMDSFKHIISGGGWKTTNGNYVRAGPKVREHFADIKVQRHLGISQAPDDVPGAYSRSCYI